MINSTLEGFIIGFLIGCALYFFLTHPLERIAKALEKLKK